MCLDPSRAPITALPPRSGVSNQLRQRVPADRARCAHPEPRSRLAARRTFLNRRNYPLAKINRQGPGHPCPASLAGMQLESDRSRLGNPDESVSSKHALGRLGAAGSVVVLAIIGTALTLQGHGPITLMNASAGVRAQFFQFYLAVAVMTVLPAAAELRRREALAIQIRKSETTYRLLAENLADTLIHTTLDGDVLYTSPAILALTGFEASEVSGRNSRDFVLAEDYATFTTARSQAIAQPERTIAVEYRARIRDGAVIWCETRMRSYTSDRGIPLGVILVVRDVTQRKAAEAELALEASTDDLTGLPNRKAFLRRLGFLQTEVTSGHGTGCIAIFDIDFFKAVNDTYGHATGDGVLRVVADAAKRATRDGDMVARVGGEEFAIVLWGATAEAATHTCERVRLAIQACTVQAGPGVHIQVTASFGIAAILASSQTEVAYKAADAALYAAKSSGRNRLRLAR